MSKRINKRLHKAYFDRLCIEKHVREQHNLDQLALGHLIHANTEREEEKKKK